MIQRIQSLYLLVGAIALLALVFMDWPWAVLRAEVVFFGGGLVLAGVTAVVALLAVFLYRNRALQRKVVLGAQVLTIGLLLLIVGGLYVLGQLQFTTAGEPYWPAILGILLPVGAYVFFFLARRGVEADINLIKSMDRLR